MREALAADQKCVGDVAERRERIGTQVRREILRGAVERGRRAGRHDEQLVRPFRWRWSSYGWRLLQKDVDVGAASPEASHTSQPRHAWRRDPFAQLRVDEERTVREIELRVRFVKMQARRNLAMLEREHGLDETADASRFAGVPHIALQRSESAELGVVGRGPKRVGQRRHLDRITDRGACAVGFDIADVPRTDVSYRERFADDTSLPRGARREVPDFLRAVVVRSRAAHDRQHAIPVAERILEPAQHDTAHSAGHDRAGGVRVERPAVSVGRKNLAVAIEVTAILLDVDCCAAGERHVALAAQ